MENSQISRSDLTKGNVIDLDMIAEEADRLRGVRGTTELKGNKSLREWLKPVGKVVKPSFGGKIEAMKQKLFDDGQGRFRCGR